MIGFRSGFFYCLQQLLHDGVGVDAFGVGVEVGDEAVAEDGFGHLADILATYVETAAGDGAGFGAQDKVLGGAGAGSPGEIVVDEVGRVLFIGAGGADEVDGVVDDVIGDGDSADDALDGEDVGGGEDGLEVMGEIGGGGFDDGAFFVALGGSRL